LQLAATTNLPFMTSQSEENYLKAIYKLTERHPEGATTTDIATALGAKAASVTEMLKRLNDKGLACYEKYKGATLSTTGNQVAINIIRKHRLWEVFLVEKLKFGWDEVHEIAEELEHINSVALEERLDEYLGFPERDPHGDPIPDENGHFRRSEQTVLNKLKAGDEGTLLGVLDHSPTFLKHLDRLNLAIGSRMQVVEVLEFDLSMQVVVEAKEPVLLSRDVTKNLIVRILLPGHA